MTVRYGRLLAVAAAGALVVAGMPPAYAADPSGTVVLASGPSAYNLDYTPIEHTSRGAVFETSTGAAVLVSDDGVATTFDLANDYNTSACTDMFVSEPPLTTDPLTWTNVVTGVTGQAKVTSGRFFLGATPDGWLETALDETSTPAVTEVHRIVAATGTDSVIARVADPSDETSAPSLSERAYVCDATGYAVTAYGSGQTSLLLGSFAGGSQTLDSVTDPFDDLYPLTVSGDAAVYGIDVYDSDVQLLSSTTVRRQVGQGRITLHTAGFATAAAIGSASTAYSIVDLLDRRHEPVRASRRGLREAPDSARHPAAGPDLARRLHVQARVVRHVRRRAVCRVRRRRHPGLGARRRRPADGHRATALGRTGRVGRRPLPRQPGVVAARVAARRP